MWTPIQQGTELPPLNVYPFFLNPYHIYLYSGPAEPGYTLPLQTV